MGYLLTYEKGNIYAAILSQTSHILLETHRTTYLANAPQKVEEGREEYLHLITKDSITVY